MKELIANKYGENEKNVKTTRSTKRSEKKKPKIKESIWLRSLMVLSIWF